MPITFEQRQPFAPGVSYGYGASQELNALEPFVQRQQQGLIGQVQGMADTANQWAMMQYQTQARMAEEQQKAQLNAWQQQQEMSQAERMRMQRLQGALSYVDSQDLDDATKQDLKTQIYTGLSPLQEKAKRDDQNAQAQQRQAMADFYRSRGDAITGALDRVSQASKPGWERVWNQSQEGQQAREMANMNGDGQSYQQAHDKWMQENTLPGVSPVFDPGTGQFIGHMALKDNGKGSLEPHITYFKQQQDKSNSEQAKMAMEMQKEQFAQQKQEDEAERKAWEGDRTHYHKFYHDTVADADKLYYDTKTADNKVVDNSAKRRQYVEDQMRQEFKGATTATDYANLEAHKRHAGRLGISVDDLHALEKFRSDNGIDMHQFWNQVKQNPAGFLQQVKGQQARQNAEGAYPLPTAIGGQMAAGQGNNGTPYWERFPQEQQRFMADVAQQKKIGRNVSDDDVNVVSQSLQKYPNTKAMPPDEYAKFIEAYSRLRKTGVIIAYNKS